MAQDTKKSKAAAEKAKDLVEKSLSERKSRPVEHEWETILEEYDIAFEQNFTMTLIGCHIHRLCTHRREIVDRTKELILRNLAEDDPIRERIVLIMSQLEELLECFHYLSSVMTRLEIQSEDVIDAFQAVAEYFGQIYRSYLGKNATPKLHILEAHVCNSLRDYKRLGIFAEDPVEREHHLNKIFSNLFKNMNNWAKKMDAVQKRKEITNIPAVQQSAILINSGTKRKFSESSEARKMAKHESVNLVKTEEYTAIGLDVLRKTT